MLTVLLIVGVGPAQARGGQLDPTFGADGKVMTTIGKASAASVASVQADGKIIVAGWWSKRYPLRPGTAPRGILVRYGPHGSLDRSFGKGGIVSTPFDEAHPVVQPDGKIIGNGSPSTLVRWNVDGSRDASFGSDGSVSSPFASAIASAVQPDGKILVVGIGDATDQLARYNADGSLDTGFGTGGMVATPAGFQLEEAELQPDGKILAGFGGVWTDIGTSIALVRYEPDGTLDQTFGSNGMATTFVGSDLGTSDGITVLPDGKIIQLGTAWCEDMCGGEACTSGSAVFRLNPDGSPDGDFGRGGAAWSGSCIGTGLALAPDGKLVITGVTPRELRNGHIVDDTKIIRLDEQGKSDKTFGAAGAITMPRFAGGSGVVQLDGKIVLPGGDTRKQQPPRFTLVRLLSGSEQCTVPRVTRKTFANATHELNRSYCLLGRVEHAFSASIRKGRVISQRPRPGATRPARTKVTLVVSKGAK